MTESLGFGDPPQPIRIAAQSDVPNQQGYTDD